MSFNVTTTFECEEGHDITVNAHLELTDLDVCPWHPTPHPWPNISLKSRVSIAAPPSVGRAR